MKKVLVFTLICTFLIANAQSQITWDLTLDIASPAYGNNHPRVVTDALGNPLLIWGNSNDVMFSRWNGTGFTNPITLNPEPISIAEASWMGPDIAAHGDTVYVVFKQIPESSDTSHIWCVHSYDGGMTFSSPVKVDDIANNLSRFPTITTDDFGNAIVGFMKFNPSFGGARWVVCRSPDFGNSFSADVLASGWSSPTSVVCDCCPGAITCSDNIVAMLYRDNNSNIRDSWVGISTDTGISFTNGMNIDQQNWEIMACPASGPDGVIIEDTLYSTFMNGASGMARVYFNQSSTLSMTGSAGNLLTGTIPGLVQQNYPRIAKSGTAIAIVWKQIINDNSQLPVLFTNNIVNGFPSSYDLVAVDNITSTDVALSNGKIFVVWQDDFSGTVKFRSGTYSSTTGIQKSNPVNTVSVYPNPSDNIWVITGDSGASDMKIELFNVQGQTVHSDFIRKNAESFSYIIENSALSSGLYILRVSNQQDQLSIKLIRK